MKSILFNTASAAVIFGVMDSLWFALFMKGFAEKKLNHLLMLNQSGNLTVNLPSALAAYGLMVIIAVIFLLPKVLSYSSLVKVFLIGAVMGFCVFGIFDFTNGALLIDYPLSFILADSLWGGLMYGFVAIAFSKLNR